MNLESINTVSDLVKANEAEPTPLTQEELRQHILKLAAPTAMALAKAIVSQLGSWHEDSAISKAKEGEMEAAYVWARDEGKLNVAWDILNSIQVG